MLALGPNRTWSRTASPQSPTSNVLVRIFKPYGQYSGHRLGHPAGGRGTLWSRRAPVLLHLLHPCSMQARLAQLSLCLSHFYAWAGVCATDPGSLDVGHGEKEVSPKSLQSHLLLPGFLQARALQSPLPRSSCTCSAATLNRQSAQALSHGCVH